MADFFHPLSAICLEKIKSMSVFFIFMSKKRIEIKTCSDRFRQMAKVNVNILNSNSKYDVGFTMEVLLFIIAGLLKGVQEPEAAGTSHEQTHWRKALHLPVSGLWQGLFPPLRREEPLPSQPRQ